MINKKEVVKRDLLDDWVVSGDCRMQDRNNVKTKQSQDECCHLHPHAPSGP